MAKHYIILSSSYSDGKRIAFDITDPTLITADYLQKLLKYIRDNCNEDVPLSTHYLETKNCTWESVIEHDLFFKDVECVTSVDAFIEKIKKDLILSALDVAEYIVSRLRCTHLKLQKLLYLCYADYLCATSKKLFSDTIYAFTYGPVVLSVYKKLRGCNAPIDEHAVQTDNRVYTANKMLPARSRILFAKDGLEKLYYIDSTLNTYGELSATELVKLTHTENSPWSQIDSSRYYPLLPDDIIKKYHASEKI